MAVEAVQVRRGAFWPPLYPYNIEYLKNSNFNNEDMYRTVVPVDNIFLRCCYYERLEKSSVGAAAFAELINQYMFRLLLYLIKSPYFHFPLPLQLCLVNYIFYMFQ